MSFIANQWDTKGLDINWETLFTNNELSNLMIDAYWRVPSTFIYNVGLS